MVRTSLFESNNWGSSPCSPAIKKCGQCKRDLDIDCFAFRNKSKGTRSSQCKECQRSYTNRYYENNTNKYYLKNKERKNITRQFILDYASNHPCVDCGENDPIVLEFDHVRGKKLFNVGSSAKKSCSLALIKTEIAKCEVVCANCHKRRTAKTQNWAKAR